MVLIGKISRGSRMDQVYLPKERVPGYGIGTSVLIRPILGKARQKLYYYNMERVEPVKVAIITEIVDYLESFQNVIVTGSFVEKGFDFDDIDVILITEMKVDSIKIERRFKTASGLNIQIIALSFKTLLKGISTDPLFNMLVSRFVSKKRVIFRTKRKIHFKLLDLQLLKSNIMLNNSEFISGKEKYKLTRNMVAISLFLSGRKLSTTAINAEIDRYFGNGSVGIIKENMVDKDFLIKYERFYNGLFEKIMDGVKNESKQKQAY